jgi:hypothetical protein
MVASIIAGSKRGRSVFDDGDDGDDVMGNGYDDEW